MTSVTKKSADPSTRNIGTQMLTVVISMNSRHIFLFGVSSNYSKIDTYYLCYLKKNAKLQKSAYCVINLFHV